MVEDLDRSVGEVMKALKRSAERAPGPSAFHRALPSPALILRTISAEASLSPSAIHGQCGVVKFRRSGPAGPEGHRPPPSGSQSLVRGRAV